MSRDMVDTYLGGVRWSWRRSWWEAVLVEGRSVREVARARRLQDVVVRAPRPLPHRGRSRPRRPLKTDAPVTNPVSPKPSRTNHHGCESTSSSSDVEAGPDTIHTHLTPPPPEDRAVPQPRVFGGSSPVRGFITPEPHKRPQTAPTSASKPHSRMSAGKQT